MALEAVKSGLDQLVDITVDVSVEKIIQLDSKGKRLRFNPDPDLFKQLATEEVEQLSEFGRLSYQIARDEWQDRKDQQRAEEEDLLANIEVGVAMGRATHRLQVKNKQPGFEYQWVRPDEKNEFLSSNRGWALVKGGPERTLSNESGQGPHVIGTRGSEELLLVKRSEAAGAAERRAKKQRTRGERGQVDEEYRAAIEQAGLPSIGDDDGRGNQWSDRVGLE